MKLGVSVQQSLIHSLGPDCAAGAALASRLEEGQTHVAHGISTDGYSSASIDRVARDFATRGWLQADDAGWYRTPMSLPVGISSFLAGAAAMRPLAIAESEAIAVVTLPGAPSEISRVLPSEGPIHASIESTDDEIGRIAKSAVSSLTIMSPFVNGSGARFAMRMFELSSASRKVLVTRMAGSTGRAVIPLLGELSRQGVLVLDYRLPVDDGYETFHAKVVLADSDLAYVGSANLTLYDRHSMELGVIVKGRAARAVAALVRSVEKISPPVGGAN